MSRTHHSSGIGQDRTGQDVYIGGRARLFRFSRNISDPGAFNRRHGRLIRNRPRLTVGVTWDGVDFLRTRALAPLLKEKAVVLPLKEKRKKEKKKGKENI
jgi:hypothetical protein